MAERKAHADEEDEEKGSGGFLHRVKDFIDDIGDKIEDAVGFGKPTADVTAIHVPHLSLDKAELTVDVLVKNPNPVHLPLVDVEYLVESEGRSLVAGTIPDAGAVDAHGSATVTIPVLLVYADIRSTYGDITPGSIIPYAIKVTFHVDVPVLGRISIPLHKSGELPVSHRPDVSIKKIKFQQFSFDEAAATLHVSLDNKNDFDLGLHAMDYEVWIAGTSVAAAEMKSSASIRKREVSTVNVPISFRPKDFGSAMWDMIRGRGTGYAIKGSIDVDTLFGRMVIPISKEGGTTRLQKEDDDDDDDEE